jgi:hypothetical protein
MIIHRPISGSNDRFAGPLEGTRFINAKLNPAPEFTENALPGYATVGGTTLAGTTRKAARRPSLPNLDKSA